MSAPTTLDALHSAWRARAADLRRWAAAEGAACALEQAALELEAALRSYDDELLTLTKAAATSGYSADHLGRLVRSGKLLNSGRPNAPRLRRRDVPLKATAGTLPTPLAAPTFRSRRQVVLACLASVSGVSHG